MLGRAAVAMWWDVPPDVRAEWEDWHSHEHMPERLGIPGFLRGTVQGLGWRSYTAALRALAELANEALSSGARS